MVELLKSRGVFVLECYEEGELYVYDFKYIVGILFCMCCVVVYGNNINVIMVEL